MVGMLFSSFATDRECNTHLYKMTMHETEVQTRLKTTIREKKTSQTHQAHSESPQLKALVGTNLMVTSGQWHITPLGYDPYLTHHNLARQDVLHPLPSSGDPLRGTAMVWGPVHGCMKVRLRMCVRRGRVVMIACEPRECLPKVNK